MNFENNIQNIIKAYNKWHAPLLDGFIEYFKTENINEVIRFATKEKGLGPFFLKNPHYKHIRHEPLKKKYKLLLKSGIDKKGFKDFNSLYDFIKDIDVDGIDIVINYDISLAIGASLKIPLPTQVYLTSTEVKKSAKKLNGKRTNGQRINKEDIHPAFKDLKPYHVENLLCIYADAIQNL